MAKTRKTKSPDKEFDGQIQISKLLEANPKFQEAVNAVRSKLGIDESNKDREGNLKKIPRNSNKVFGTGRVFFTGVQKGTDYYKYVSEILKRFNLREDLWGDSIGNYVLTGEFGLIRGEEHPVITDEIDPVSKEPVIIIKLNKHTSLDDIKRRWDIVELLKEDVFGAKSPRFQNRENLERDIDIFNLYHFKDYDVGEISFEIKSKYGQDLGYSNIRKIISSMNKEFGIKGKKLLTAKQERLNKLRSSNR